MVYAIALGAPFVMDDDGNINSNPAIRDLGNFTSTPDAPGNVQGAAEYVRLHLNSRVLAYFSFAINYAINGLDPWGYRIVNVAIHIANAIVLLLLLRQIIGKSHVMLPFMAAMLFVAHPVETQAVTYISQRFTSMGAFFYLLALLLYMQSGRREGRGVAYACSLLAALAAMKTKETAITLPFAMALFEIIFRRGTLKQSLMRLMPFFVLLPVIPLALGGILPADAIEATNLKRIPWQFYLMTELRVIATYLRLIFIPINQSLEYGYQVLTDIGSLDVMAPLVMHLTLIATGITLAIRSRRARYEMAIMPGLMGLGILWFYLTLALESSVIPMGDLMFEHRAYLPSIGVFMAVSAVMFHYGGRVSRRAMAAIVLMLMALTIARNATWRDPLVLWQDTALKAPSAPRPKNNLGNLYMRLGATDDAIKEYRAALLLRPGLDKSHANLGVAYLKKGLTQEARMEFGEALRLNPQNPAALYYLPRLKHFSKNRSRPE